MFYSFEDCCRSILKQTSKNIISENREVQLSEPARKTHPQDASECEEIQVKSLMICRYESEDSRQEANF
jgi:hypothetical protein